jgi:6-phosphogluconolactonase
MGSDGHTASLFPETAVLEEREQWVAAPWVEKFHTHRITLTPPVFNAAKRVLFVVGGSDKDKAAEAVLEGPFQPKRYPAQIVNPVQGDVVWLLDREAASRLKETSFTEWTRDSGKVM